MKKLFLGAFLIISTALLLSLSNSEALAQEDTAGLSISPTNFEFQLVAPDEPITNQVKVTNTSSNPIDVSMKVEAWEASGDLGNTVIIEDSPETATFSISSWTTISPATFRLNPGSSQTVSFTINVPEGAEPGSHWGAITAVISGSNIEGGTAGSAVGSKRASLILMTVPGDLQEELLVDTFFTDSFQEYGPVNFELKFKNVGNVHVQPRGFIKIEDLTGKEVAKLNVPAGDVPVNVLPGAVRAFDLTWEDEKPIGRFTATLVVNYGSNNEVLSDSITFIVFPWKIGLAILSVIIILILILFFMRKRLKAAGKALAGKN